ncbi:nucleotidyltransferase domain-containing protein [Candidatus Micrarchaeota archaeon]|nr:nucleotidyltransferase domain-containing protein [Candidatus Micrarchaeota archaeon]
MVQTKTNRVKALAMAGDFKKKARKKYSIQKMILFGSQAAGTAGRHSDIDLLVIAGKFRDRANYMSALLREWHIVQKKPVDFVCLTRAEYEKMHSQATIARQAEEEGVEI